MHWRQSRLLPKPATNWQQSRMSPIRSTLLPALATNRQQHEFDSLSRSTLLPTRWTLSPIRSTLSPVCTGPKRHGRLSRLSTKSTVLNSTLLPECTARPLCYSRANTPFPFDTPVKESLSEYCDTVL